MRVVGVAVGLLVLALGLVVFLLTARTGEQSTMAGPGQRPGQEQRRPAPVREGTESVNGAELYYRMVGDGPPLVLLHGFTNTGAVWDPFVSELSRDFTLIIPDMRGHGRSTNPSGGFTHRLGGEDVFGLLDVLGIDRFSAAGHSSGAIALLEAAVLDPGRIEAMVLIDGAHRFPEATRELLGGISLDTYAQEIPEFRRAVLSWHPGGADQLGALLAQLRAFASNPDDGNLTAADLGAVTTPTLIAHGDRDDVYPVELALEMYRALPNAELWIMPDVDHGAVFAYPYLPPGSCSGCEATAEVFPGVVRKFLQGRQRDGLQPILPMNPSRRTPSS